MLALSSGFPFDPHLCPTLVGDALVGALFFQFFRSGSSTFDLLIGRAVVLPTHRKRKHCWQLLRHTLLCIMDFVANEGPISIGFLHVASDSQIWLEDKLKELGFVLNTDRQLNQQWCQSSDTSLHSLNLSSHGYRLENLLAYVQQRMIS